jgi:hypothetical protein
MDGLLGKEAASQRKDINDELRYVLLTETSYPYFQDRIQSYESPELDDDAISLKQLKSALHAIEVFQSLPIVQALLAKIFFFHFSEIHVSLPPILPR